MKYNNLNCICDFIANKNLGAITAISAMYECNRSHTNILCRYMKEIGLSGSKIWVGYKYCKFDARTLMSKIKEKDKKMFEYINKVIRSGGCGNVAELEI